MVAGAQAAGVPATVDPQVNARPEQIQSYKKGGAVKKTGLAKLHKGERVLSKAQNRRFTKAAWGKTVGGINAAWGKN